MAFGFEKLIGPLAARVARAAHSTEASMAERQETKLVPLSRGVPQWCFRQTLEKEMVSFKRSTVELAMIHRAFKVFGAAHVGDGLGVCAIKSCRNLGPP